MNNIEFKGKTTEYYIFPGEPACITHADFIITNHTDLVKQFLIKKCEINEDGKNINMEKFHVALEDSLTGSTLIVRPGDTVAFTVSFPFYMTNVRKLDKYSLNVQLESGADTYQATSEMRIFLERKQ